MIVVDTSALVAIIFQEPEREEFLEKILSAEKVLVSTVTVLETKMVAHGRRGERAVVMLEDILRLSQFEIISADQAITDAAFAAFIAYGKGRGHPASLNFGDITSYAVAKVRGLPLLFKGNDFSQTDIAIA